MDQDAPLNAELPKILQCQQPPSETTQLMKDSGGDMNQTKYDPHDDQIAKTQIRLWLSQKLKCQGGEVEKESQNSNRLANMEEKLNLNSKTLIVVTSIEEANGITDLKINLASKLSFFSISKSIEIGISQKIIRSLIISKNENSPEISNSIPLKEQKQVKPLPATSDQTSSNENTSHKEVSNPKDISFLEISKFSSSKQDSPQIMLKNENKQAEKCPQVSQNLYDSPPKAREEIANGLDKTFVECSPFDKNIKSKFSTPVHQKFIEKPPGEVTISPEAIIVRQFSSKGCKKQKKRQKSPNEPMKIRYNDDTSFDIRTKSKQSKFLSEQKIQSPRQKKVPIKAYEQQNIFNEKAENVKDKEGMCRGKNIGQKKIKKNKLQIIDEQLKQIIQNEIRIQSLENDPELRSMQEKIKNNEWYQYLQCLSLAQTQITYLTQQLGYIGKFIDGNSQILPAMYSCTAEIGIMSNGIYKKYIGVCQAQKSKKEARHYASILCLAELYSRNSFVWNCFKQIKMEKAALRQPLKSDNRQILERWWRKTDPEEINSVKLENDKQALDTPDVDKYIKSLKSCKHDLYYFIAQNNKIFMNPRWLMRKPNIMGYWEAEGFVRYQIQDKFYEYRYKNKGRNKKECEQLVSQSLLRQIYRDFPLKFKKYRQIKNVKGLV